MEQQFTGDSSLLWLVILFWRVEAFTNALYLRRFIDVN